MLDGLFAHTFAVSPREVIDVLGDGAHVVGASSMGALRAADCHPAGMRGVGLVYRLFRLGVLTTDDEVAVTTDAAPPFAARSTALIDLRYSLARGVRGGLLGRAEADALVDAAAALHFSERSPDALGGRCPLIALKRRDAELAIAALAGRGPAGAVRPTRGPIARPERYAGHDRHVGVEPDALAIALTRWLWASGRYQRYLWPLVAGEPALARAVAAADPSERPQALRDAMPAILRDLLADLPALAPRVLAELEFAEEADAEILRWHAIQRLAGEARSAGLAAAPAVLAHVRDEVAIAHGFRHWDMLLEDVADGLLWDAIPISWIHEAADDWAVARTHRAGQRSSP